MRKWNTDYILPTDRARARAEHRERETLCLHAIYQLSTNEYTMVELKIAQGRNGWIHG